MTVKPNVKIPSLRHIPPENRSLKNSVNHTYLEHVCLCHRDQAINFGKDLHSFYDQLLHEKRLNIWSGWQDLAIIMHMAKEKRIDELFNSTLPHRW